MLFESASLHTPSAIGCHEAARWACVDLPEEVAVVMGNINKFGELPIVEWGKVTGEMIYYACIN